jgi:plasmid maintenance system antidote protein VapI
VSKTPDPTMTRLLREALAERGESLRAVADATGVNHVSILRFLAGKQSLRLDMADRLAVHFGIKVSRPRPRRRKE